MPQPPDAPEQLLAGYTLIDRLGSGGYGEVWRAHAPGGLTKAVKYVFGRQDESRAAAEGKALERIKEVRHPFLLSLERIEVIDGRLIVVTELADGSLRDRFYACQQQGLPGIPREELLGYLRDTADALDFLSKQHELQHLDIKPENLLLVADHVKVADFGLVKNVGGQAESLVGGITPTYAAPEVFQGRPSIHSDQYSLAVLFQELLTGALPFHGSNAAELTLEHLNRDPDVAPLCEHDRFVVSRALSKAPGNRFEDCTALVNALAAESIMPADTPAASASPRRAASLPAAAPAAACNATEVFETSGEADTVDARPILIDLPPTPEPTQRFVLAPTVEGEVFEPSPAVFIGIGGAAARVLQLLRQKHSQRFGLTAPLPTMPMLVLDTDQASLAAATRGAEEAAGLDGSETVALPVRRPQDYRDKASTLLHWLPRRWLYNIPRSLKTEGIRPLGRLALVDHARQASQRIKRTISESVSQASLAEAEELTGLHFNPQRLRVYLCGSISGGAGGGMLLDVAYAVRAIVARLGVDETRVLGVLTHSSGRDTRRGELARVNAFSFLAEYQHFLHPENAYPGDAGCGLPAHEPGTPPFDSTYVVDCGSRLDSIEFEHANQAVADYLYLDSTTAAQAILDRCRDQAPSQPERVLRSFSLKRRERASAEEVALVQTRVLQKLVFSWTGSGQAAGAGGRTDSGAADGDSNNAPADAGAPATKSTDQLVPGAVQLTGRLKLEPAGLASLTRGLIEAHTAGVMEAMHDLPGGGGGVTDDRSLAAATEPLDQRFQQAIARTPGAAPADGDAASIGQPLAEIVRPLAARLAEELTGWLVARVDVPSARVDGARRAVEWFEQHLSAVFNDLDRLRRAAGDDVAAWYGQTNTAELRQAGTTQQAARIRRYRQLVDHAAIAAAGLIAAELYEQAGEARRRVDTIAATLLTLLGPDPSGDGQPLDPATAQAVESATAAVKTRVDDEVLRPLGGLTAAAEDQGRREQLVATLDRLVQQA
ncbi:MAG: tubulin-like doman-containing protein, partial [Planctomycetota bacterium]